MKIDEISGVFSAEERGYFWKVTSICCDGAGRIFAADSGWNTVFVFNRTGQYVTALGRMGQGPGEFMAAPGSGGLAIDAGYDGKIYVQDTANMRMTVFSPDLSLERTFALETQGPRIIDKPHVDSKGNIYYVSFAHNGVIQKFNHELKWQRALMEGKYHFRDQFLDETESPARFFTGEAQVQVVISENDRIFALSNYALKIYCFNSDGVLINEIDLKENRGFYSEYRPRLVNMRKRGGAFIKCLLFLGRNGELGVCLWSANGRRWDIYMYDSNSQMKEILTIDDQGLTPVYANKDGVVFCLADNGTRIITFR